MGEVLPCLHYLFQSETSHTVSPVDSTIYTSLLKTGKQTLEFAVTREYYEDIASFGIIVI